MVKDRRADPDVLLASLEQEDRGKLTVFLGAAAGVGKTYTMLEAARERMVEGMDVEELLAAGINVYTTLNIQHLESLNDVVAQITEVTVRETVPDRILENAAQIQLVDIPPEELIQRLKEGKLIIGKPLHTRFWELLHGSVVDKIIRQGQGISVQGSLKEMGLFWAFGNKKSWLLQSYNCLRP